MQVGTIPRRCRSCYSQSRRFGQWCCFQIGSQITCYVSISHKNDSSVCHWLPNQHLGWKSVQLALTLSIQTLQRLHMTAQQQCWQWQLLVQPQLILVIMLNLDWKTLHLLLLWHPTRKFTFRILNWQNVNWLILKTDWQWYFKSLTLQMLGIQGRKGNNCWWGNSYRCRYCFGKQRRVTIIN